jgi:hypothetical protein
MFDLFLRTPSYPLDEALRVFGNAELVEWLDQNQNSQDEVIREMWRTRRRFLENSLTADIRTGALVASAFQRPLSMDSKRTPISADIWNLLDIDYAMCTARFDNLSLVRIEIRENDVLAQIYGRRSARRPAFLEVAGEKGEIEDSDSNQSALAAVSLSEDLELLTIGENEWRLRGEIQQDIIKQLVDAHPTGKFLKSSEVLSHAGSNVDTIAKAFNGSPNWPTLKRFIERDGGLCRLLAIPQDEGASEHEETLAGKDQR